MLDPRIRSAELVSSTTHRPFQRHPRSLSKQRRNREHCQRKERRQQEPSCIPATREIITHLGRRRGLPRKRKRMKRLERRKLTSSSTLTLIIQSQSSPHLYLVERSCTSRLHSAIQSNSTGFLLHRFHHLHTHRQSRPRRSEPLHSLATSAPTLAFHMPLPDLGGNVWR